MAGSPAQEEEGTRVPLRSALESLLVLTVLGFCPLPPQGGMVMAKDMKNITASALGFYS